MNLYCTSDGTILSRWCRSWPTTRGMSRSYKKEKKEKMLLKTKSPSNQKQSPTWLWSKVKSNKSAANVTPDLPPPLPLQCISTGGFVLWPAGISSADAIRTELNSSRNSEIEKNKIELNSFLIKVTCFTHLSKLTQKRSHRTRNVLLAPVRVVNVPDDAIPFRLHVVDAQLARHVVVGLLWKLSPHLVLAKLQALVAGRGHVLQLIGQLNYEVDIRLPHALPERVHCLGIERTLGHNVEPLLGANSWL